MKYDFTKDLETGYKLIDDQHRALIGAINKLFEACAAGRGRDEVQSAAKFLMDYTASHFGDEEKIQLKHKYPDYPAHKRLHENFKLVVANLVRRLNTEGPTIAVVGEINSAIAGWLITHIKKEDKKLANYIAQNPA